MRITRYFQYAFWICILIAAVGLGGRLWYIAANSETGYQSLAAQWWNATFGLVWDSQQNIGFRPPAEQAQYWLQETERILRDHPRDATLAMGAAWMLDAPSNGFDYARNPQKYWARVEAVVRSIETDDVQMKEITAWAENEVLAGSQRTTDSSEGEQ